MNFNDYQKHALKSLAITDKSVAALAHRTLGLTGEAGIIANAMKKVIRDKNGKLDDEDMKLLKEKLGDVMYYVATLADFADLSLEEVVEANVGKSTEFKKNRKP